MASFRTAEAAKVAVAKGGGLLRQHAAELGGLQGPNVTTQHLEADMVGLAHRRTAARLAGVALADVSRSVSRSVGRRVVSSDDRVGL